MANYEKLMWSCHIVLQSLQKQQEKCEIFDSLVFQRCKPNMWQPNTIILTLLWLQKTVNERWQVMNMMSFVYAVAYISTHYICGIFPLHKGILLCLGTPWHYVNVTLCPKWYRFNNVVILNCKNGAFLHASGHQWGSASIKM